MPKIYVMTDHTGSWPVLWSGPRPPRDEPGKRSWSLVAEVRDDEVVPTLHAIARELENKQSE